jgi:hypothetical protein
MKFILCISVLLIGMTAPVYADCIYNGRTYPTGSRLGGLVCTPDGSWQRG